MPDARNKVERYEPIPDEELNENMRELEDAFLAFCEVYRLPDDIEVVEDSMALAEIVRRVDKRKAYFSYFHKGMTINELKETSLYAYWIIKFHPFALSDKRYEASSKMAYLNESFAIYLITGAVAGARGIRKLDFVEKSYGWKLCYSFRYRSLTMDSLMLLVESIRPKVFRTPFEDKV